MAAYELVPTDEHAAAAPDRSPSPPHPPRRTRLAALRTPLLVLAAFCLTALVSFKAGQWSAEHRPSTEIESPTAPTAAAEKEEVALPLPTTNSTDMPGDGKYSVG